MTYFLDPMADIDAATLAGLELNLLADELTAAIEGVSGVL